MATSAKAACNNSCIVNNVDFFMYFCNKQLKTARIIEKIHIHSSHCFSNANAL